MSSIPEQITAALKKLGPSAPRVLADSTGVDPSKLAYHVKTMLEAGTLKAAGRTASRIIALPDQKIEGVKSAPSSKGKRRKGAAPAKKGTPAPRPPAPERFIAAVDVDSRLVIVTGAEPRIFTEAQTEAIATLLLQHYKA